MFCDLVSFGFPRVRFSAWDACGFCCFDVCRCSILWRIDAAGLMVVGVAGLMV